MKTESRLLAQTARASYPILAKGLTMPESDDTTKEEKRTGTILSIQRREKMLYVAVVLPTRKVFFGAIVAVVGILTAGDLDTVLALAQKALGGE
jgi:hypothetical protein